MNKKYPDEFKQEAVRQVLDKGGREPYAVISVKKIHRYKTHQLLTIKV